MQRRACLQLMALGLVTIPVLGDSRRLVKLSGKLIVAGAGTKQSYLTGNFQLITEKERLILTSSSLVSEAELKKFRDQLVSLEAYFLPVQAADSDEQAPIDPMTGETIEHPASYQVRKIGPYRGKPFKLLQD
jgi:hypothetical protein